MTPTVMRQVMHVMRKDVRMTRWFALAYVALVLLSALSAIRPAGLVGGGYVFLGVLALGAVLTAFVIQADSTVRPDSFWASQPLDPIAVFGAKVAFMAGLTVIGLLGMFAMLIVHHIPVPQLPAMLGTSALILVSLFSVSAMIAVLTPDLRTFLVVSVLLFIALNIIATLVSLSSARELAGGDAATPSLNALLLPAMLWLVARQYRTRDVRGGILPAAALLVGNLGLSFLGPAGDGQPALGEPPARLRADLVITSLSVPDDQVHVYVRIAGASENHAYLLADVTATFELSVGQRIEMTSSSTRWLNAPIVPLGSGIRIPGAEYRAVGPALQLTPARDQRTILTTRIAAASIQARVIVFEPFIVSSHPLRPGGTAWNVGRRMHILAAQETAEGTQLKLVVSRLEAPTGFDAITREPWADQYLWKYALIDEERGTGIILRRGGWSSSGMLVMAAGTRETINLTTAVRWPDEEYPGRHTGWLGRARLVWIDWRPLGSFPVSASFIAEGAHSTER